MFKGLTTFKHSITALYYNYCTASSTNEEFQNLKGLGHEQK